MRILFLFSIAACYLIVSSCQKRGDFEVSCKILTITEKSAFPDEDVTLSFYYNGKGDPVQLDYNINSTGKPDYFLSYDNRGRLKEMISKYGNVPEFIHKYYYNASNFISYDTVFYPTGSFPPGPPYNNYIVNQYSYDSKGRVTGIASKHSSGLEYFTSYSYDGNGNLVNGYAYDNKVSFLRTNLIFAFINRNYSMNNPSQVLSYNSKNLPTSFATGYGFPSFMNMHVHELTYTCDQGHNWHP